jgi:serine/threonine-protein kinase
MSIKGTPHYLSPEAIQDPQAIDARTDLYALGAVGYYLLAGRHVFDGKTIVEVCLHHVSSTPIPLSEASPLEIPAGLETLIMACLEKDPAKRPASGQELADALDQLVVARWTRADAEAWWDAFGGQIERRSEPLSASPTEQTVAVDLDER